MSSTLNDGDIADFEDALNTITLASWNRVRTDDELKNFINSKHSALVDVEI